jgi:hypothetical protein
MRWVVGAVCMSAAPSTTPGISTIDPGRLDAVVAHSLNGNGFGNGDEAKVRRRRVGRQ